LEVGIWETLSMTSGAIVTKPFWILGWYIRWDQVGKGSLLLPPCFWLTLSGPDTTWPICQWRRQWYLENLECGQGGTGRILGARGSASVLWLPEYLLGWQCVWGVSLTRLPSLSQDPVGFQPAHTQSWMPCLVGLKSGVLLFGCWLWLLPHPAPPNWGGLSRQCI
jgi:hypothetical protein